MSRAVGEQLAEGRAVEGMQSAATTIREVRLFPVPATESSERLSWRFSTRSVAIRLFLTCWLIYGLHFATNTVREIYPALSLGDKLSFNVVEYAGLHPDIFEIPGRGAFINNNPGASIVGAIPYLLSRPVTDRIVERTRRQRAAGGQNQGAVYNSPYPMAREFYQKARERGYDVKFGLAAAVTQVFGMAPLSALSVVVMFFILDGLRLNRRTAFWLSLLYAFATPILYRTAQLNQNLLVSHCALFAFALLWHPWDGATQPPWRNYLLAGFLCGWAVVLDYSGLIVLLVLGSYGLLRRRQFSSKSRSSRDIWCFIAGVAICAALLMAYQWSSFGNPLFPAQRYMPATELSRYGYNGIAWPQLDLLWQTAFGPRFGLFIAAPLLLLAVWIPGWWNREKRLVANLEMWCILTFTIAFFLFCSANQFGRLQFNTGVRYIVPVVPFLFILTAGVLIRLPRIAAIIVGVATVYWSWCQAMYRDVEQGLGIIESVKHVTLEGFRLPWITTLERMGYVSVGTSVLPLFALCALIILSIWMVGRRKGQYQPQASL